MKLKITGFLCSIMLVGCISIRSGEYVGTPNSNFNLTKKQNIKLSVGYEYLVNENRQAGDYSVILGRWTSLGEETLKEISNVDLVKDDNNADFFFEVTVKEKTTTLSETVLPIISGLTLTLFPSYSKAENYVETVVKNKKGEILGKISKKENFSIIIQLFLIFALPFTDFVEHADQQKRDLFKATFKEIAETNLLTSQFKK